MKNIIEILDRRYQSFINQKEDWNFFKLLADYMKYALENPETEEILNLLGKRADSNKKKRKEWEDEDVELWEILDKLILVYLTLSRFGELENNLSKARKKNKFLDKKLFELWASKFEMEEIKNGRKISRPKNKECFQFYRNDYEIYATRIHNYLIQELWKKEVEKPAKKQIKKTTLYLNKNGELYREPKDRYCYAMGKKSNRHKLIRFLIVNTGYQQTKFITIGSGYKDEKTTRTEIGKIRNNIEKYLKIKGKDFLQSKKESGYRINPKYKVILKNE